MSYTQINKTNNRGIHHGYRSGLEATIVKDLQRANIPYLYEAVKLSYTKPPSVHKYTPDFKLVKKSGELMFIESKGRFTLADRKKHLLIKAQHPELDLRFVFSNPNQKLYKGSKITYGQWCDKNEFKYTKGLVSESWKRELA